MSKQRKERKDKNVVSSEGGEEEGTTRTVQQTPSSLDLRQAFPIAFSIRAFNAVGWSDWVKMLYLIRGHITASRYTAKSSGEYSLLLYVH